MSRACAIVTALKVAVWLVGSCLGAVSTYAGSSSCVPGVVFATEDNFVRRGQPTTVQDFNTNVAVKGENDSFNRKGWIKFNLEAFRLLDPGVDATSATLTLYLHAADPQEQSLRIFDVYGLTDDSLDNWAESTLTWNNAPGNSLSSNGVNPANTTLLGTFQITNPVATPFGTPFSISGAPLVSLLNADTNGALTVVVIRRTIASGNQYFGSSETGLQAQTQPRLAVSVSCEPPCVIESAASLEACAGGGASFSVVGGGSGPLSYRWRFNTMDIDAELNPSAASPTLLLTNVQVADAGAYDCVISNACGQVTSGMANLAVIDPLVCPGDVNGDFAVDFADLNLVLGAYNSAGSGEQRLPGDANCDLSVDFSDLNLVLGNFGEACR